MITDRRRVDLIDSLEFSFYLTVVTSFRNIDTKKKGKSGDLNDMTYRWFCSYRESLKMREINKYREILKTPEESTRAGHLFRLIISTPLFISKLAVEFIPRVIDNISTTLWTDFYDAWKTLREPHKISWDHDSWATMAKKAVIQAPLWAALGAVSIIPAGIKALSLIIRSVTSYQEVWSGAAHLDVQLLNKVKIIGDIGPVELCARGFSTALLLGSLFTPAAIVTAVSAVPVIGSAIAKAVVAPIINKVVAPAINIARKATPAFSTLWSAVTETAVVVAAHYIKKPLAKLSNYLFPKPKKANDKNNVDSRSSSNDSLEQDSTWSSFAASRPSSADSRPSTNLISPMVTDATNTSNPVTTFVDAIKKIPNNDRVTLENLKIYGNEGDLRAALNNAVTSTESNGVITQLDSFIELVTGNRTIQIDQLQKKDIETAIVNFYLEGAKHDPNLHRTISDHYQNSSLATRADGNALSEEDPYDLSFTSDDEGSPLLPTNRQSEAQATSPTKGQGLFDRARSTILGDKNKTSANPKHYPKL